MTAEDAFRLVSGRKEIPDSRFGKPASPTARAHGPPVQSFRNPFLDPRVLMLLLYPAIVETPISHQAVLWLYIDGHNGLERAT